MNSKLRILPVVLLLCPASLSAQAASPSVFIQVGAMNLRGDKGSIGGTVSFGGGILVPIHRRWIAELDVQTAKFQRESSSIDSYRTSRTLALGNVLYFWGSERAQFFAGAGIGAQIEDDEYTELHDDIVERFEFLELRPILFAPKGGFVLYPLRRLGVRTDFYAVSRHVGVRIGMSFRFR